MKCKRIFSVRYIQFIRYFLKINKRNESKMPKDDDFLVKRKVILFKEEKIIFFSEQNKRKPKLRLNQA